MINRCSCHPHILPTQPYCPSLTGTYKEAGVAKNGRTMLLKEDNSSQTREEGGETRPSLVSEPTPVKKREMDIWHIRAGVCRRIVTVWLRNSLLTDPFDAETTAETLADITDRITRCRSALRNELRFMHSSLKTKNLYKEKVFRMHIYKYIHYIDFSSV